MDITVAYPIEFPAQDGYPECRDILYIPEEEYAELAVEDLEARAQARYEAFKANHDFVPQPLTKAERQDAIKAFIQGLREDVAGLVAAGVLKPRLLTRIDTALSGFDVDRA